MTFRGASLLRTHKFVQRTPGQHLAESLQRLDPGLTHLYDALTSLYYHVHYFLTGDLFMAKSALIAAILLPLPFAALPLFAVLFSGSGPATVPDTAYAPITVPVRTDADSAARLSHAAGMTIRYADDFGSDCQDLRSES